MSRGWYGEPERHSLASYGVKTTNNIIRFRELNSGEGIGLKEEIKYELTGNEHVENVHVEKFEDEIEVQFNVKGKGKVPSSIIYEISDNSLSGVLRFPKTKNPQIKTEKIKDLVGEKTYYSTFSWTHQGEERQGVPHIEVTYENVKPRCVDNLISDMSDWIQEVMESGIYE